MGTAYRKCLACGLEALTKEDLELFVKKPNAKYCRANYCKICHNSRMREHEDTSKWNRRATAKRDYGITLEEYEACMSTSVVCEVCGTTENLCYDHDHITMKFRGVLCSSCNKHIGGLGDTLESVHKAYLYMLKHYNMTVQK